MGAVCVARQAGRQDDGFFSHLECEQAAALGQKQSFFEMATQRRFKISFGVQNRIPDYELVTPQATLTGCHPSLHKAKDYSA